MPTPSTDRPVLDHIAVAAERHEDVYPRYIGDLGGRWKSGGVSVGFSPEQVEYGNGMKVELLEPAGVERNDFLRRFLDRRGPGPHHLTFKVPDIRAALADVDAAGLRPVNVDLSDPGWQEAFLHPKEAFGIVVQLAQAVGEWVSVPPPALPSARPAAPADLVRIVHTVADLHAATVVFAGVLRGEPVGDGIGESTAAVELAWPGGGRLVLREGDTGGEPGRLQHVEFALDDPGAVPGARLVDDGYEVAPEDNFGVRLLLTAR